jgi:hypothetical protein
MSDRYIILLTKDLKYGEYQLEFGLNSLDTLYACKVKDLFRCIASFKNIEYAAYVTFPSDVRKIIDGYKIKINKLILHEPLIPIVDFINIAVKYGAEIHIKNDLALCWASERGHLDIVKCLLSHGADIHSNNDHALRYASNNNHLDVVKYLIANNANIHASKDAAFRWASEKGHLAIVECLIKYGADINVLNNYPLILASENGHLAVVKCLIANGADIHAKNDYALRCASENGHIDIVEYLISHGSICHRVEPINNNDEVIITESYIRVEMNDCTDKWTYENDFILV